jgi:hypothetical protein
VLNSQSKAGSFGLLTNIFYDYFRKCKGTTIYRNGKKKKGKHHCLPSYTHYGYYVQKKVLFFYWLDLVSLGVV